LNLIIAVNSTGEVKKLDGLMGIGVVLNLSLLNSGTSMLYVERAYVHPGWGGEVSGQLGNYLDVNEEDYMRHMLVPLPDPAPDPEERKLTIYFDVVVERGTGWFRREGIFWEYPVNIIELTNITRTTEIRSNPAYYFDKVNDLVKTDDLLIRSLVENSTMGEGPYTIQKIVDAYEFVRNSLDYIADPDNGQNEWITPMTCLEEGGGDCEDFSILLGSIITAMGGNARIIITHGHAFNAVYIGDDASILTAIEGRYGLNIPFQILEDKLGKWLIIEPQSQLVFGWFPLDVEPVPSEVAGNMYIYGTNGLAWQFVDSDEVSVVDIYFK
jgi:transglutaminase-like putative cysteine protease